jgi:predicted ATP-dependent serine protease
MDNQPTHELLSADYLLTAEFPEPVWAVPEILPIGLTILAGAPKVGKSWFALQIAKAIGSGGEIFGMSVEQSPVLYLALEDKDKRLAKRMKMQLWGPGTRVDFMVRKKFIDDIGYLQNGGSEKLADLTLKNGYKFVVIDTLSRAISGAASSNQRDEKDMTALLSPLQDMANESNIALMMIDHHKKKGMEGQDVIRDVLGSTAKGAMADTVFGLYKNRGKKEAHLWITGRDVEEQEIKIELDKDTGLWSITSSSAYLTEEQKEIIKAIYKLQPVMLVLLDRYLNYGNPGNLLKKLRNMEGEYLKQDMNKLWSLINNEIIEKI